MGLEVYRGGRKDNFTLIGWTMRSWFDTNTSRKWEVRIKAVCPPCKPLHPLDNNEHDKNKKEKPSNASAGI